MDSAPLFVYGTLRRGFYNHHYLRGCVFLGKAVTREPHALYVSLYPYVVRDEAVCPIVGEVYIVTPEVLAEIDTLEDHPDLYERQREKVILESDKIGRAWIYFARPQGGVLVPHGDYARWRRDPDTLVPAKPSSRTESPSPETLARNTGIE